MSVVITQLQYGQTFSSDVQNATACITDVSELVTIDWYQNENEAVISFSYPHELILDYLNENGYRELRGMA